MTMDDFRERLLSHFDEFGRTLATDAGDWVVKGFIDVYRNIYTISVDTKVVSKIIKLMLFPVISQFAAEHDYKMVLSEYQNHYPDISFMAPDGTKIAFDLKSTYRRNANTVSGFTLGAFTGYFRRRHSTKNITSPTSSTPRTLSWASSTAAATRLLMSAISILWTISRTLYRWSRTSPFCFRRSGELPMTGQGVEIRRTSVR